MEKTKEKALGHAARFFHAPTVFRDDELAFVLQLHFKYVNCLLQLLQLK